MTARKDARPALRFGPKINAPMPSDTAPGDTSSRDAVTRDAVTRDAVTRDAVSSAPSSRKVNSEESQWAADAKVGRDVVWVWNIPLLIKSGTAVILLVGLLVGIYIFQSRRLCVEMLNLAQAAEAEKDYAKQSQWLNNYVRMRPKDSAAIIQLAIADDNGAPKSVPEQSNIRQILTARKSLVAGIGATGTESSLDDDRLELRRRLIRRQLQLGSSSAADAEAQIVLLNAKQDDAEALGWLATAMFLQRSNGTDSRKQSAFDKSDYWRWLASQPVGDVLRLAVQANENDLELASMFISIANSRPDLFGGKLSWSTTMADDLASTVNRLAAKEDDARAQLLTYSYKKAHDPESLTQFLDRSSELALERLERNVSDPSTSTNTNASVEWNWRLGLTAAIEASASKDLQKGQKILERLAVLPKSNIPSEIIEQLFLELGNNYWQQNKRDLTLENFSKGVAILPESLELARIHARFLIAMEKPKEAETARIRFQQLIEKRVRSLDGTEGALLSMIEKSAEKLRLERYEWHAKVVAGQIRFASRDFKVARDDLVSAFRSPLQVPADERVAVGALASQCLAELGLWDESSRILEQCLSLKPDDKNLLRLSADAWQKVGVYGKSLQQMESIDDGSYVSALRIAQLTIGTARDSGSLDLDAARKAIRVARERWNSLSPADQATQPRWPVDLLEFNIPANVLSEIQERMQALEKLAEEFSVVAEVQRMAAVSLASYGRSETAKLAVQRLRAIAEVSGKEEDVFSASAAEISMYGALKEYPAAVQSLNIAVEKLPKYLLPLSKAGAQLAMQNRNPEEAANWLRSIPADKLDVEALMLLAQIGDSSSASWKKPISEVDFELWVNQLRSIEGIGGGNWRVLAIQQLLRKAGRTANRSKLISEAEEHFRVINSARPQWAIGLAAGGNIAAFKSNHGQAVELFRGAISFGDRRASTVLGLVSALTESGKLDEASEELVRLSGIPDSVLPISALEISLAGLKGDMGIALERARKAAAENQNNVVFRLLLAKVAWAVAAMKSTQEDERVRLRNEAWDALENAGAIAQGKNLEVWRARIRFRLDSRERQEALHEIDKLLESSLPKSRSIPLAAITFLELNEFEKAQKSAQEVIALDPTFPQHYLLMALIADRSGDSEGVLKYLKEAHRTDGNNSEIRARLAKAYVEFVTPVPWQEVDALLDDNAETTSTGSRILRAQLSLQKGDENRQQDALSTLVAISRSTEKQAWNAKRTLANFYRNQWIAKEENDRKTQSSQLDYLRAHDYFSELIGSPRPESSDFIGIATLLIESKRFSEAEKIIQKMEDGEVSLGALRLRVMLSQAKTASSGEGATKLEIHQAVDEWTNGAVGASKSTLYELAGKELARLGQKEESLVWLERAYLDDPSKVSSFAFGLTQSKQNAKAFQLCMENIGRNNTSEAAVLLLQIAMQDDSQFLSEQVEKAIAEAIKSHSDSAAVAEAVATLRLLQERYAEAVKYYEQAERLSKDNPSSGTMNNLAIGLAEIPERKKEALPKIEAALARFGPLADLLDTLGIVHAKLGNHLAAKEALGKALLRSRDPRSQMRMVEALVALSQEPEAKDVWSKIDMRILEKMPLTRAEKRSLDQLKTSLATRLK